MKTLEELMRPLKDHLEAGGTFVASREVGAGDVVRYEAWGSSRKAGVYHMDSDGGGQHNALSVTSLGALIERMEQFAPLDRWEAVDEGKAPPA